MEGKIPVSEILEFIEDNKEDGPFACDEYGQKHYMYRDGVIDFEAFDKFWQRTVEMARIQDGVKK